MENKDKPAFPEPYINHPNLALSTMPGLTKREYFAAMAMQGILAGRNELIERREYPVDQVTIWAIQQADELLKQLEDGNNKS